MNVHTYIASSFHDTANDTQSKSSQVISPALFLLFSIRKPFPLTFRRIHTFCTFLCVIFHDINDPIPSQFSLFKIAFTFNGKLQHKLDEDVGTDKLKTAMVYVSHG